jgi:hypothetical protein
MDRESFTCFVKINQFKYVISLESRRKDNISVNFGEINGEDVWQTDLIQTLEQWRELIYMMLNLRSLLLQ